MSNKAALLEKHNLTEDQILEIHTTDRRIYKQCREKWDFSSNIRYNRESVKPVENLWLGSGFHEGAGAYYDPDTPRKLSVAIDMFDLYCDEWKKTVELTDELATWLLEMRTLGHAMLKNYVDFAKTNDAFDVIWVEREFHVPLYDAEGTWIQSNDGRYIVYSFRVDALVIDKHGRLWVLEHKTTAQFFSNTDWLMMDDQPGSYLWCLHRLADEDSAVFGQPITRIEGVIYNWVKKKIPAVPQELVKGGFSVAKNQDTTAEIVKDTFGLAYGPYAKWEKKYKEFYQYVKQKENNFVRREPVRRNQKELSHLWQSLLFEVWEMVNEPAIYRNPSSFNCGTCPFIHPCLVRWEGGDYEGVLMDSGLYREREKPFALRGSRE